MELFEIFNFEGKQKKRRHEKQNPEVDIKLVEDLIANAKRQKGNEDLSPDSLETLTKQPEEDDELEELGNFSPRVVIQELETQGSCMHEVVIPVDIQFAPLRDKSNNSFFRPAKEYKFILDSFQKEAILCIENNQSVLGKFFVLFYYCFLNILYLI